MKIKTGQGTISLFTLLAIYSISMVTSLPGLAISPILGSLETIFKGASDLQLQMLESLPSFIIVPFILLAGRLSMHTNQKKVLIIGLSIFFGCSIIYPFVKTLILLLIISALLGIGAGMVIPFSTGLIANYFTGKYRTKQLGIASSITNITLVLATLLSGILANINWHYSFLVYCLSGISLLFAFKLKNDPAPVSKHPSTPHRSFTLHWPVGLMLFYYLITILALTIPFNLALYMENLHIGKSDMSGSLISVFFLSMTLPGFFINKIISWFKNYTNFIAMAAITSGLILFAFKGDVFTLVLGVTLIGLGYGCMQPVIYDKTANSSTHPTYALALVMSMNYIAIITYPFIIRALENLFSTDSSYFPFWLNTFISAAFTLFVYFRRKTKTVGISPDE
ncbi:MFS transporter [Gabonibacter chumensis]|uniref:MFS transporter n=1 Tax=Gabonibacter chumensis TaxID=2972474 RepID=UPI002572DF88|nr:MFS transporter [Gabonibacter chumensis]MCR9011837.1 MFS transporter [Gabonibacter chumensis]